MYALRKYTGSNLVAQNVECKLFSNSLATMDWIAVVICMVITMEICDAV